MNKKKLLLDSCHSSVVDPSTPLCHGRYMAQFDADGVQYWLELGTLIPFGTPESRAFMSKLLGEEVGATDRLMHAKLTKVTEDGDYIGLRCPDLPRGWSPVIRPNIPALLAVLKERCNATFDEVAIIG